MSTHPSLLVLAGIDACGKTTVLEMISKQYTHFKVLQWKDLSKTKETYICLPSDPASYVESLPPMNRALFFGGLIWELYEKQIRPSLDAGQTVIVDSYCYKWWAKETILKLSDPILDTIFSSLPKPDLVVFIDTDPSTVITRKIMSSYEKQGTTPAEAVDFQATVRNGMLKLIPAAKLRIVDGNTSLEQVYHKASQIMQQYSEEVAI